MERSAAPKQTSTVLCLKAQVVPHVAEIKCAAKGGSHMLPRSVAQQRRGGAALPDLRGARIPKGKEFPEGNNSKGRGVNVL